MRELLESVVVKALALMFILTILLLALTFPAVESLIESVELAKHQRHVNIERAINGL